MNARRVERAPAILVGARFVSSGVDRRAEQRYYFYMERMGEENGKEGACEELREQGMPFLYIIEGEIRDMGAWREEFPKKTKTFRSGEITADMVCVFESADGSHRWRLSPAALRALAEEQGKEENDWLG